MRETTPELGERLAAVEVFGLQGERVPLGSLWRDATAVLVFVRHFG